jgi:hypothetical protein
MHDLHEQKVIKWYTELASPVAGARQGGRSVGDDDGKFLIRIAPLTRERKNNMGPSFPGRQRWRGFFHAATTILHFGSLLYHSPLVLLFWMWMDVCMRADLTPSIAMTRSEHPLCKVQCIACAVGRWWWWWCRALN